MGNAGQTTPRPEPAPYADVPHQLFCRDCGYGVVVRGSPPECPMCRGSAWRERAPLARWN
jgi:hypothetical protein